MDLSTKQKGDIAEAAVILRLLERGLVLLRPVGEDHPFDLVILHDGLPIRVQVKSAVIRNGCVKFSTKRVYMSATGPVVQTYAGVADLFAVFCPENQKVYFVPVQDAGTSSTALRIDQPRADCERTRWASKYEQLHIGDVAELVRHGPAKTESV